ncbi:MAG: AMP-binding protein [Bacteroidetes bacterium]|nr:AMP-binding protein [Bacteroidota bacterium]MDA1119770.1 AMP-binding protein [Bacteroidota bacterium]
MSQLITIANKQYPLLDLLSKRNSWNQFSDYDQQVLQYLLSWVNDQQVFSLITSGSTGKPKHLKLSKDSITKSANRTIRYFNLSEEDKALICIDIKYIGGMMMLFRCMLSGMDIIVTSPTDDPLGGISDEMRPTFLAIVPLQLQNILNRSASKKLSNLKAVIVGGGPISDGLRQQCLNSKLPIYHTFGMTETVSHIALCKLDSTENNYELLPGIKIKCDDQKRLMIMSDMMVNQWITTNDVVEIVDDTRFKWLGRLDNVINSGGIKIHPEMVEPIISHYLFRTGLQGRSFLSGVPDLKYGKRAVLMYEGRLDADQKADLVGKLKILLPRYQYPREVWCIQKFLETETGKIKRQETMDSYLNK